jgi:ATP adenylyltransferase
MSKEMTFSAPRKFLDLNMKLSHIYQSLLVKSLIDTGGMAAVRQLASIFLAHDESLLMYYKKRLNEMPIKVLSKHGVIKQNGDLISLTIGKLTLEQKAELRMLCEQKMPEYIAERGLNLRHSLNQSLPAP